MTTDIPKEELPGAGRADEVAPFVWYELHTPDAGAAAAFYERVLGWTARDAGMPDRKYTLVSAGDAPVGGLLPKPSAERAQWVGYIGVSDVREYAKRVEAVGGVIYRAAEVIPGVGTFAVAGDPDGLIFTLFEAPAGMSRPEPLPACTPGAPAWRELAAKDRESALQFYCGLFGWTKDHAMDMGPMGVYQIFCTGAGPTGGIMATPNPQTAGWVFYFNVAEIEAAIERVKQFGGRLLHGPSPVPGGQHAAQCVDPQGATFGLVGPAKE